MNITNVISTQKLTRNIVTGWVLVLITSLPLWSHAQGFSKSSDSQSKNSSRVNTENRDQAAGLVQAALKAMGGEEKLRSLKNVTVEGIGHEYAVEQSERPEGPYIVTYQQITEIRDIEKNKLRRTTQMRQVQVAQWLSINAIISEGFAVYERGGRFLPRTPSEALEGEILINLSPERLFLTALEAKDLRSAGTTVMENVSQNIIKFSWRNVPITVYLNAFTNLPTAVETMNTSPENLFWSVWGDYITRTVYSNWTLEPGGLHYPHQRDITRNGYPLQSFTITDLKFNTSIEQEKFQISEEAKKQFSAAPSDAEKMPLGNPKDPASEIAPNILYIPGNWGVTLVRQDDGVLVIEAPVSSGYSAKVAGEVQRRYPGMKIKGVVSTSDAFPHIGGIREYAASGTSIFALDLNIPLLERVLSAPRKAIPDSLELKPRKAKFKVVNGKTMVGAGPARIEIYPVRTETGERMLMVYFPEHRLLYASDLVQKLPNGKFFAPQYLTEIQSAVERENLQVDRVFALHLKPIPWSQLTDAVASFVNPISNSRQAVLGIANKILDADYRADQIALQKLYDDLGPFSDDSEIGALVCYWRGFAQWRRAINGFNDSVEITQLEQSLKLALAEFEKAIALNPTFEDAIAGASSVAGILMFLYGKNPVLDKDPSKSRTDFRQSFQRMNDTAKANPNHPRMLWVLAQSLWSMPVQMGGGQEKAIETSERGLRLIREQKNPNVDPLLPSWGEPELLMNLAYHQFHKTTPDLEAAEKNARLALVLVPHWHYVRDILLPQIEAAKLKKANSK